MPKQIPYSFSIGHCILKSKDITSTKSVVLSPLGWPIGHKMATMHLAILSRWLSSMRIVPRPSSASARHWEQLSSKSQWLAHKWSLQTALFSFPCNWRQQMAAFQKKRTFQLELVWRGKGAELKEKPKKKEAMWDNGKWTICLLENKMGSERGKKVVK